MVGAPKASAGGYGITSLPGSTGTQTTKAPTAPETGKGAKQTGGGREAHNPVLQRLMADGFEGQGAQGKGLAVGHQKKAKKAGKGGGEAGETPTAGKPTTGAPTTGAPTTGAPTTAKPTTGTPATGAPTTGAPQDGYQKLLADLTKLLEQFKSQYPQPQTGAAPNGNTGIVPPGVVQGSETLPVKLGGI